MHLTPIHLHYWEQRKAPSPSWARHLKRNPRVTIDEIINLNARVRFDYSSSNTLHLLKRATTHDELCTRLRELALEPGTVIRPERRAGYCAKWLHRLSGVRFITPYQSQYYSAHLALQFASAFEELSAR